MLKLASNEKTAAGAVGSAGLPAHVTCLSLSWLNGQFRALAVHRGVAESSWSPPEPVEELSRFPELLREAVAKTGYHGSAVSLVLGHARLTQQILEAPPVKGAALHHFIGRQVQKQQTFGETIAWSYQTTIPTKDSQGLLLHLIPRRMLDQLLQGAEQAGLHLTAVLPPTAVLQAHLALLPLEKEELAALVAGTGSTASVLVGRKDGQIVLGRSLTGNWGQHPGRLALDLNRTILYVNQQFGLPVGSVWLFGPGAGERQEELHSQVSLPVKVSPVEADEYYWAREALKLPAEYRANLITLEQQQAPQRRLFLRVMAAVTGLLMLGATITFLYFQHRLYADTKDLQDLNRRASVLQGKHKQLQEKHLDLVAKQEFARLVHEAQSPPVPAWFLGYLSEAVPPELVLTNFSIKRDGTVWKVQLAGMLQPTTDAVPALILSNALAVFDERLTNGPFHLELASAKERSATTNGASALELWTARMATLAAPRVPNSTSFLIEGAMR